MLTVTQQTGVRQHANHVTSRSIPRVIGGKITVPNPGGIKQLTTPWTREGSMDLVTPCLLPGPPSLVLYGTSVCPVATASQTVWKTIQILSTGGNNITYTNTEYRFISLSKLENEILREL